MSSSAPGAIDIRTPSIQQGPKLVGSGSLGDSEQGTSVAISADGNTAVVGGSNDDKGVGSLWVFTRSGGRWSQQGSKLQSSDSQGASGLGTSVAISADGNTIVAGGPGDGPNFDFIGAAWIFTRSSGAWSQQGGKLVGNDYSTNGFPMQGTSVGISADGNTVAVGGNGDNDGTGATWVYTRVGTTWAQNGSKLVGTGHDRKVGQGASLALSADASTLIIGTSFEDKQTPPVWVFHSITSGWQQDGAYLTANKSIITQPGQNTSLAVSADGSRFVLGENCDNGLTGAIWIFAKQVGVWRQGNKLVANDAVGAAEFGCSISMSADGNVVVVGGNTDNGNTGALWVFTNETGSWEQKGAKLVGTGAVGQAYQGNAVRLSADGFTALSGGFGDNGSVGATWVFVAAVPA